MAHLIRRRLKKGDVWYVRYTVDGRVRWLAAGPSKRKAEKVRDAVAGKLLDMKHGFHHDKSDWTLARLAPIYLDRLDAQRPKSSAWRADRMKQLVRVLGDVALEELSIAHLERYAADRILAGRAPATVNADLAVLRHAIICAVRWKDETGLQENRLAGWRPVRGRARQARYLDAAEVGRVVDASRSLGGPCHEFVRLFLATGARPGELLQLQVEDFGTGTVRLPALKGGVTRNVVVDPELVAAVVPVLGAWTKDNVRTHWRRVRKLAGLEAVRFYDLRHTVASEMLRRGSTVRDVQRLLGHRSSRMTERYSHFATNASALPGLEWK